MTGLDENDLVRARNASLAVSPTERRNGESSPGGQSISVAAPGPSGHSAAAALPHTDSHTGSIFDPSKSQ